MDKKALRDFYESLSMTDEQSERIFKQINDGGSKMRISKKRLSLIIAATLVFIIGILTVTAANFIQRERLFLYLNPPDEQSEKLAPSLNAPMAVASDNGVTLTIVNTLADKHGIYVMYDVMLPENTVLTEEIVNSDLNWERYYLSFDTQSTEKTMLNRFAKNKITEFHENTITMLAYFSTADTIDGDQKISFNVKDLNYYTRTDSDDIIVNKLAECDIKLSWDFTYSDTTKTYDINKQIHIADGKYDMLKSIEVSPISLLVIVEGDDVLTGIKPLITFKDGTNVEITSPDPNSSYAFSSMQNETHGGIMTVSYNFIPIINVEDIESIKVGDLVFPIN